MCSWARFFPAIVVGVSLLASAGRGRGADGTDVADDERIVRRAGIGPQTASLLAYFRRQTMSEAEQDRIVLQVRRLGEQSYRARERAEKALIELGPVALPALRRAVAGTDLEVRARAKKCIARIQASGTVVPVAAVRVLARQKPAGACAVLLGYLPCAGADDVEDAVMTALVSLSFSGGMADPALASSLKSPQAKQRAAAGFLLGEAGSPEERKQVRRLLADADLEVRFHAAHGLLLGKDTHGMPALIALLEDAPLDLALRAENVLASVKDAQEPPIAATVVDGKRRPVREAWASWWKTGAARLDFAHIQREFHLVGAGEARRIARASLQALADINREAFKATVRLPVHMQAMFLQGRTEVESEKIIDRLFAMVEMTSDLREIMKRIKYKITRVGPADEYLKIAGPLERSFLGRFAGSSTLIVYVQAYVNDERISEGCVMVHLVAGRAWVVGFGQAQTGAP